MKKPNKKKGTAPASAPAPGREDLRQQHCAELLAREAVRQVMKTRYGVGLVEKTRPDGKVGLAIRRDSGSG